MAGNVYTYLFIVGSIMVAHNHIGTHNSFLPCAGLPSKCFCKDETEYTNGQYHLLVDCSNAELHEVPRGIPNITTVLTLNGNNIAGISDGLFENLTLLKYLDLSNNVLKILNSGIFAGLSKLQTLELNGNLIRYNNVSIPETVFEPLLKLKRLNLHQIFASDDVWNDEDYPVEALSYLDNLEQLLLDGLSGRNFAAKFSVLNATKLQRLIMSGIEGRCGLRRIIPGMFNFSRRLVTLIIERCSIETVEHGSFLELTDLKKLDLSYNEKLEFKSLANISFGLQNRNLYELRLIKIHEMCGDSTRIVKEDLIYTQSISVQHVYLDSNRLAYFSIDSVYLFPRNVSTLSLRDNMLLPGGYMLVFFLSSFGKVIYVDLAGQTLYRAVFNCSIHYLHVLSDDALDNVNKKCLDEGTHAKANLNAELIRSAILKSSERTNIEETNTYLNKTDESPCDRIESAPYIPGISNESLHVTTTLKKLSNESLPKMLNKMSSNENITVNQSTTLGIKNDYRSLVQSFIESDDNYNVFCLNMGDLLELDLSFLNLRYEIGEICIRSTNNLTHINLQNNVLWSWKGPVTGFERLTSLNLAWNSCEQLSLDFFHSMPGLLTLNVSRNFLNPFISNDINGQIFEKQTHLKKLDLSDNKLTFLPPTIFKHLTSLEDLYLSKNFLMIFDVELSTHEMFLIDIGYNMISCISKSTTDILNNIVTANGGLTIDLSNNSLSCSCENTEFVKWVADSVEKKTPITFINFHEYQCKYINESLVNLSNVNNVFSKLKRECASYLVLILISSISTVLVFMGCVACIMYRYRWNLRYFYYSAKLRIHGYKPLSGNDETDDTFEYDVFVSYCSANGRFVKNSLLPELEEKRHLRVLVHDRDFWAGNFVTDNIMRAITHSRKTLILLSNSFLQSHWCVYEMNMARMERITTGRDVLCVVMLEPVDTKRLPLEIMDIIRNQTYIEWIDKENQQDIFWSRVDQAIRQ